MQRFPITWLIVGRPQVVLIHSAVLHGRRAKPGGDAAAPRYFVDVSYCQPGPRRWPSYACGAPARDLGPRELFLGGLRNTFHTILAAE